MATDSVDRAFLVFLQLDEEQRNEFINLVNGYTESDRRNRVIQEETLRKAYLGPTGRACPTCGRTM